VTYDIHSLLTNYLTDNDNASVDFITYQRQWPGTPTRTELWDQAEQWSNHQVEIADTPNNGHPITITVLDDNTPPKQAMWERVLADYTPSNHPSHIACAPPDGNKPPPGIRGAITLRNRLILSTIFRFVVAHVGVAVSLRPQGHIPILYRYDKYLLLLHSSAAQLLFLQRP
jgi:hypothetical protein